MVNELYEKRREQMFPKLAPAKGWSAVGEGSICVQFVHRTCCK
jgi:hypothetical protein